MNPDTAIGQTLISLREQAHIGQHGLAAHMRSVGIKWAQNTVSSVETGSRPLRLLEAVALADYFRISLDELANRSERSAQPRPSRAQVEEAFEILRKSV